MPVTETSILNNNNNNNNMIYRVLMTFLKIAIMKSLLYLWEGGVNEFFSILFTHTLSDVGEVQCKSTVAVEQG